MKGNEEFLQVASLLKKNGELVRSNPASAYVIPKTIKQLGNIAKTATGELLFITSSLYRFMDDIWSSVSSASSELMPLEKQLKLIRLVGENWIKIGQNLEKEDRKERLASFIQSAGFFETEYKSLMQKSSNPHAEKRSNKTEGTSGQPMRARNIEPLKRELLKYIKKFKVLKESEEPRFLLRSGYRSFYFFSIDEISQRHQPAAILKEILKTILNRIISEKRKTIERLVWLEKTRGESTGAVPFASWLDQEIEIGWATLPPPRLYDFEDRIKGTISKGCLVGIIDDVVSTGEGALRSIQRIRQLTSANPAFYIAVLARSLELLRKEIEVTSVFTREELIREKLWKPEILKVSFSSPLWGGLDMTCDYLREILVYTEQEGKYQRLHEDFKNLLLSKFGSIPSFLVAYLTNLYLLCWGSFYWDFIKATSISEKEIPKFIERTLEFEKKEDVTLSVLANVVKGLMTLRDIKKEDLNTLQQLLLSKHLEIIAKLEEKTTIFLKRKREYLIMGIGDKIAEIESKTRELLEKAEEYERSGKYKEAVELYEQAIGMDPSLLFVDVVPSTPYKRRKRKGSIDDLKEVLKKGIKLESGRSE